MHKQTIHDHLNTFWAKRILDPLIHLCEQVKLKATTEVSPQLSEAMKEAETLKTAFEYELIKEKELNLGKLTISYNGLQFRHMGLGDLTK